MIANPKLLAEIIGYSLSDINKIIDQIKRDEVKMKSIKVTANNKTSGVYYYRFAQLKSSGKLRVYHPSAYTLKTIQKRIQSKVFNHVIFPFYITGSTRGRSGAINGQIHSGQKFFFQTDLVGFFDFVTTKMVYNALVALGFSPDVSRLITRLTTFLGHLPQGAVTSPFLANLVGLSIDDFFIAACHENQIKYSRYVDDLTFSSNTDFNAQFDYFLRCIKECGFLYSYKKTHYRIGSINLTGVVTSSNGIDGTLKQKAKCLSPGIPFNSFKGILGHLTYIKSIRNGFDLKAFKENYSKLKFPDKLHFYTHNKHLTELKNITR